MSPARPGANGSAPGLQESPVRVRRKELGLTQQQMAEAAEVSRQTIISIETGDYAPSVYLALRVAALLDTTVESLWGRRNG
jgi:putative transcriptional regulator